MKDEAGAWASPEASGVPMIRSALIAALATGTFLSSAFAQVAVREATPPPPANGAVVQATQPSGGDPLLSEILSRTDRDRWNETFAVSSTASSQGAYGAASVPQSVATTTPIFARQTLAMTQDAIQSYRNIVSSGGWPVVPSGASLRLGDSGPAVTTLRRRLMVSGDLGTRAGLSPQFDSYVDAAVKRFQKRHGLPADGVLGTYSFAALNVPADIRLRQLEKNYERLANMQSELGDRRYVMVNIPGAEIEAVENGRVAQRHTAIVGRASRPTPILSSKIYELNLNPYWNAPKSIVRKDIIPLMRKNPNYLKENGIRIYDWNTKQEIPATSIDWNTEEAVDYHFKQDPGSINAMRAAKINFPNEHAVYMHDTPQQGLFDQLVRFESSGCVRVKNIRDLLTWLSKDTPGWNRGSLEATIASGNRTDAKLAEPVGVHFAYITGWSNKSGVVQFRDDIYKLDGSEQLAFGPGVPSEQTVGQ